MRRERTPQTISTAAREWEAMDVALPQVPTPYRPGLYRIELPRHLIWT